MRLESTPALTERHPRTTVRGAGLPREETIDLAKMMTAVDPMELRPAVGIQRAENQMLSDVAPSITFCQLRVPFGHADKVGANPDEHFIRRRAGGHC
jgi:hypothetical protein